MTWSGMEGVGWGWIGLGLIHMVLFWALVILALVAIPHRAHPLRRRVAGAQRREGAHVRCRPAPRGPLRSRPVGRHAESEGNELFYGHMVDNQAIVVPETIDAIRALTKAESEGKASIAKTDAAMGIGVLHG